MSKVESFVGRSAAIALLGAALAAGAGAQGPSTGSGQAYPARTVRIVVPYPPGGGNDLLARMTAQKLGEKWKQTIVVDNRGGASGMIGAEAVARSPADGYTILLCASPECALNATLYPKMPYDPTRDLSAVTQLAVSAIVLAVHPSLPARNAKEFIALAKKRPGELSYSSVGAGSPHHIAGEWMKLLAGIDIIHVPYKGGGPQMVDLMGGHIHGGFVALPVIAPYLKSGRVRAIAVTTARRSPVIPEVQSLGEAGLAGFDVSQWYGVMVPAGTPAEITARLQADFVELLGMPDVRTRMADLGAEPVGNTAAQFSEFIRSEIAKYRKIVKATGITID
jgi:tripartite-type tricarboxylate transporter receptor subunit TctC